MTFFYRKPFVLLVGDEGSILVRPDGTAPLFWDNDDINAEKELHKILKAAPFCKTILLADTQAQEIRIEAIPPLRALDRKALLKRRLQQKFPPSSLNKALPLGQANDKALFFALHDCAALTTWKAHLAKASRSSVKTALLPFEACRHLLPMIPDAEKGWAFLMVEMHTGGWRQIITFQGQPVFTRQSPLLPPSATEADVSSSLRNDLMALLGYLPRLGLGFCDKISGLVLTSDKISLPLLSEEMKLGTVLFVTANEAAAKLGLKNPSDCSFFPDLLLALTCQQKGTALTLHWPKDSAPLSTAFSYLFKGIVAAIWTVALFYCSLAAERPISSLMQRHALLAEIEAQQESRRALFNKEGWTSAELKARDALTRKKIFNRPVSAPWPFLEKITPLLGTDLTLATFDWNREETITPTEKIKFTLRPSDAEQAPKIAALSEAFYSRFKKQATTWVDVQPESLVMTPCSMNAPCEPEVTLTINGGR